MKSLTIAVVAICALGLCSISEVSFADIDVQPQLTPTLVAWISSQCELIVEEMEAIVKQNSETSNFSLVSYLRFMTLYNELKVVAAKKVEQFKWVTRKAKAFANVYESAMSVVVDHLYDLDAQLREIEFNEPKSKQVAVTQAWMQLYQTIRYIATHAPKDSKLEKMATDMLTYSPTGNSDKVRSTRYVMKMNAFSR